MKRFLLSVLSAALVAGTVWATTEHHTTLKYYFDAGVELIGGLTLPTGNLVVTTGSVSTATVNGVAGDTGNAEVTLPENSVGPDEIAGPIMNVIFCGELAENGTTYLGPAVTILGGEGADYQIGTAACDALDNTTEATADAPLFTNVAFKVMGGFCKTDGTLGASETLTYTVRTATASVVTTDGAATTLTCTISTGQSDCRILAGSTTDIAAGATIAMQAVEASNNADDNGWCVLTIALK